MAVWLQAKVLVCMFGLGHRLNVCLWRTMQIRRHMWLAAVPGPFSLSRKLAYLLSLQVRVWCVDVQEGSDDEESVDSEQHSFDTQSVDSRSTSGAGGGVPATPAVALQDVRLQRYTSQPSSTGNTSATASPSSVKTSLCSENDVLRTVIQCWD